MPDRVNLYIPSEMRASAKAKAAELGTSVSAVVRGFLRLWLDGAIPTPPLETERPRQLRLLRDVDQLEASEILEVLEKQREMIDVWKAEAETIEKSLALMRDQVLEAMEDAP